jgi:hypothetical protein
LEVRGGEGQAVAVDVGGAAGGGIEEAGERNFDDFGDFAGIGLPGG